MKTIFKIINADRIREEVIQQSPRHVRCNETSGEALDHRSISIVPLAMRMATGLSCFLSSSGGPAAT